MQLYDMTKQASLNQPRKFQNIVVHPGGMYIIVIFQQHWNLNEMRSALEFYVTAVYGGIRGIFNWKSWVKSMKVFQSVAAALLQRFLSTGQKIVDDIEQYLEIAHFHPTDPHRVDNFLLPTLMIHQLSVQSGKAKSN